MKILIVGYGSIGRRHTENLIKLGFFDLIVCTKNKNIKKIKNPKIKIFESIDLALNEKPDVTFICNETSLHVKTAIKVANSGSHIFIEKPISHSLSNLKKLTEIITRKKLVSMIGCNMRFHDGIKMIKKLIDKNEIGRIFSVKVENGSFLPDWHPWEDYRISYASNKNLGGGVVLTQIHEIDYLYWFFGKVNEVFSYSEKLSNLELDVEDYSGILIKFNKKIIGEIHLDYFQKPSVRTCKIIGTKGEIIWDWNNNHLQIYKNHTKKFVTKIFEEKYDRNKMFLEELKYFFKCINEQQIPMNSIYESLEIQKIVIAIKKSSNSGLPIKLF